MKKATIHDSDEFKVQTYRIVRMFFRDDVDNYNVRGKSGLTLEEARRHCQDPDTSSRTCRTTAGQRLTKNCGPWFDGFEKE